MTHIESFPLVPVPDVLPPINIVINQNSEWISFNHAELFPEGEFYIMTYKLNKKEEVKQEEVEWWNKLDTLDKATIAVPILMLTLGSFDLVAHLPFLFPWMLDVMLIIGGISLLFTSLLLAKRIGLK